MKNLKRILGTGLLILGMVFTFNAKEANAAMASPLCATYCESSLIYNCVITQPGSSTTCYWQQVKGTKPVITAIE
ncbi:MAG: hypothetical protein JXR05_15180 [Flavobacteriaceae bacterium]